MYLPTKNEIASAAFAIVEKGRTPMNSQGFVSCDQVRAFIVRSKNGQLVDGLCVSGYLRELFGAPIEGRYQVKG